MQPVDAIRAVLAQYPGAFIVSSCGFVSRDLYNADDRPESFYLVGSMGMALPVALGMAIARPTVDVVALDGDGAALMNLGAMAMVGAWKPRNLTHVVLDNGVHESTGGQKAVGVDFPAAARAAGYASASSVSRAELITRATLGPTFLRLEVDRRVGPPGRRVQHRPEHLVERVMSQLRERA